MEETSLYRELSKRLDQGIIAAPSSSAGLQILKILFPDEEAEIAIKLPFENKTLPELKKLFPERADSLEESLKRMVQRGTVYTGERPGKGRQYRLLPSYVGWAETPFWRGSETEETRKLSSLWLKYREGAFGKELGRGDTPVMRVIPVSKKLQDSSMVLPFDALKPLIEQTSYRALARCSCRQMKSQIGEGCDHSLETCLHFGTVARYMVEQKMAREVSKEEALAILAEAKKEGLVHTRENIDGKPTTICNCCGCCCMWLDTQKQQGFRTISPSNYVARVDADACAACGTCEERCQMDAIVVRDEEAAAVNEDLCIGCGVCTPTCPTDAVDLFLRGEVRTPPEQPEFIAARYKAP